LWESRAASAAARLLADGHRVGGLVRRPEQVGELVDRGVDVKLGDLVNGSMETLAGALRGYDVVLFAAGAAGAGGADAARAVDGDGPAMVAAAAQRAGLKRFYLVSAFPEAWRERHMGKEFEDYMIQKKRAETLVVRIDIDWVILRPSALNNQPGTGHVDLGLAKVHEDITRDDVADTLVALMMQPTVSHVILEVSRGSTPINQAVAELSAR
jgi:uncharacterized protein YbjT (DUF2867 family)